MKEFPGATSSAPGVMGVDWEVRVDFERLRRHRIAGVHEVLEAALEDLALPSIDRIIEPITRAIDSKVDA